jgi:hypothetical protein
VAGVSTNIEGRVRVHRVVGRITPEEVASLIRANQSVRSHADLPALWDFSEASLEGWSVDTVLRLAERIDGALVRPAVAALVVASPETYGSVRIALALLKAREKIEGHVFCSEASARAWLSVREHRLERMS